MTSSTKKRTKKGVVVSAKMDKTVVVKVDRYKVHPLYQKRFKVSTKFKAHDPRNEFKTGDKVVIEETRPISRDKHWRVRDKKV